MYESCTTNTQTERVVRTAGGYQEIPFYSPLQPSPSLLVSFPSHHLPREAAASAAGTHCPLHGGARNLLYTERQKTSFGDKKLLGLSMYEQFPITFLWEKMQIFDVKWGALKSAFLSAATQASR